MLFAIKLGILIYIKIWEERRLTFPQKNLESTHFIDFVRKYIFISPGGRKYFERFL